MFTSYNFYHKALFGFCSKRMDGKVSHASFNNKINTVFFYQNTNNSSNNGSNNSSNKEDENVGNMEIVYLLS